MPGRPQDCKSKLISEEAADWLVCLRGQPTVSERQEYVQWLKQSPAHVAEMLRLSNLDAQLRRTDLEGILPAPARASGSETSNVIDLVSRQVPAEPSPKDNSPEDRSPGTAKPCSRLRYWKLAASVSALALTLLLSAIAKLAWFDKIIETEAGEWRHFALADGSIARMGPRSRLRLDFNESRRSIYLSRGEAVFQVVKDPGRPFLVHAEQTVVRAVGTEFGVEHHDDAVVVTVAEGEVAVSRGGARTLPAEDRERDVRAENSGDDSSKKMDDQEQKHTYKQQSIEGQKSIAVSAGEQVSVSRDRPVTVRRVDSIRELAWAHGKLIFHNETTLAQAVEQFNRRNRMQIEVEDEELSSNLVCCIFNADDPESFALSVATKQNVSLIREGPDRLRLLVALRADSSDRQPLKIE